MIWVRVVATALVLLLASSTVANDPPRIAIIIDDIGYRYDAGKRAIELPGPVSYAFLPGTPRARSLAELANEHGKEILLHLPLQARPDNAENEPSGIHLDMSRTQFRQTFDQAIESVPHVVGVNSHRGSLLTRHPGHMRWLMEEIRKREDLFFIDSYTTHESVALQLAREVGVEALKRDVFLDPDRDPATVAREFERLKQLADKQGAVIAIGHPYPATLALLEEALPKLESEGYRLVSVSELVRSR